MSERTSPYQIKEAAELTNEHSLICFLAISQNNRIIKVGQDLHGHQAQPLKRSSGDPYVQTEVDPLHSGLKNNKLSRIFYGIFWLLDWVILREKEKKKSRCVQG